MLYVEKQLFSTFKFVVYNKNVHSVPPISYRAYQISSLSINMLFLWLKIYVIINQYSRITLEIKLYTERNTVIKIIITLEKITM